MAAPALWAGQDGGTLAKLRQSGVITIGHRQAEPPFSYVVDGKPTGYSTELCVAIVERLAKKLGLPRISIDYVPVSSATRFVMMRTGKIDMECAATTNTAERRKLVAFSYPHFLSATRFVSLKTANLHRVGDLAGRSVAATSGTVNLDQLNAVNRQRGLNISVLLNKENEESFAMVTSGKASAYVMDDILLAGLVAGSADPQLYEISQEALSAPEPYGLLLPHDDETFIAAVNESLRSIYESGEIRQLYSRWFEEPIPPQGQRMNLPLSAELRAVFEKPGYMTDHLR
ncbi:amino acid ABC transporter substrate-binding protein [Allorhizobium undicola]|nr:amino acid ABC transporter substrate-binding protein [Allorhizobium undicola]